MILKIDQKHLEPQNFKKPSKDRPNRAPEERPKLPQKGRRRRRAPRRRGRGRRRGDAAQELLRAQRAAFVPGLRGDEEPPEGREGHGCADVRRERQRVRVHCARRDQRLHQS